MQSTSNNYMPKNLRHHLRVPADFIAHVETERGEERAIAIANISRAGIMLDCDQEALETLLPNAIRLAPQDPIALSVQFDLPLSTSGLASISNDMHVIYCRRLSRDSFHVGLEFNDLDAEQIILLEKFITEAKLN